MLRCVFFGYDWLRGHSFCLRLRVFRLLLIEKEIKAGSRHLLIIVILVLFLCIGFVHPIELISVVSLISINLLPLVHLVHLELLLAAFMLDLALPPFVADFAKLESDASILYLLNIVVFFDVLTKLLLALEEVLLAILFLLVAFPHRVLVTLHQPGS